MTLSQAEQNAIIAEEKYSKGAACFEMGDLDEALTYIRGALALSPGNWKYHYNIAFVYWKKDLLEVAINHYKLFIRYALPNDPDIQNIKNRIKMLEKEIKNRLLKRKLT